MALALAVVAIGVAVVALGVAWRAWPRKDSGGVGYAQGRVSRRAHGLTRAVEVLVVLDLLAAAGLGVSFLRKGGGATPFGPAQRVSTKSSSSTSVPGSSAPGVPMSSSRATSSLPPSTPTAPTSRGSPVSTSTPTSTSTSSVASASVQHGPIPVLVTVSPASGAAGEDVTLRGHGFFSKDGRITVMFGAVEAPVSCPNETTCHASVPPRPAKSPGSVGVTVSTETGSSNQVAFKYVT
jgi:hypothetical protein